MVKKQKVCLLELRGSHFECLETQIHFLKDDLHLTMLINSDRLERTKTLTPMVSEVIEMPFSYKNSFTILNSFKIARIIKNQQFDYIILNTAQGGVK